MGLTSRLGLEGDSDTDRERIERVTPIGGAVGGAVGAALGVVVTGSAVQAALLAGAGAAIAVLATWLVLAKLR